MAGTIRVWVIPSLAASCRKRVALKVGSTSSAAPAPTTAMRLAIRPVTWVTGTASMDRSDSVSAMQPMKCRTECTTLKWVSIAPLGRPVVPEV